LEKGIFRKKKAKTKAIATTDAHGFTQILLKPIIFEKR